MSENIQVKISDYKISTPPDRLVSYGLGSCVGLSLHDERAMIGGLAHILLPSACQPANPDRRDGKYADIAVKAMLEDMLERGCKKENIVAKLAGGASMFKNFFETKQKGVGERNVEAVCSELKKLGIDLVDSDTGGDFGRSIEFFIETGEMKIRSLRHGDKII